MFSAVILFHHWFPLLEKIEIRAYILPCNFPAVLIIFTGRGGAGNPPFPAGRGVHPRYPVSTQGAVGEGQMQKLLRTKTHKRSLYESRHNATIFFHLGMRVKFQRLFFLLALPDDFRCPLCAALYSAFNA